MLTNLEEYNRVKCAQYWPGAGDSNYVVSPNCLINVGFCTEKRYSDFIVRELNMTVKTQKKDETKATTIIRKVRHYHYLQWKDFNAPEHAPGMLRFVKRINEQHEKSAPLAINNENNENTKNTNSSNLPPIVVHCSAGVGRSGTLIAIDSLMEQLKEEGQISIYKTVCELRHQRNYLVQSVVRIMMNTYLVQMINFSLFFISNLNFLSLETIHICLSCNYGNGSIRRYRNRIRGNQENLDGVNSRREK